MDKWLDSSVNWNSGFSYIETVANLKLLSPSNLAGRNLKESRLYSFSTDILTDSITGKIIRKDVNIAACLKILASERVFISSRGIEVIMPIKSIVHSVFPTSDIRRFEQ